MARTSGIDDIVVHNHWRNQPRDPKGTETGGQWTDENGIVERYEKYRDENVTPLYNKLQELRLSIGANPANHYSDNAEYIEIQAKYDAVVKISNTMYAEYKTVIDSPEYKRVKLIGKVKAQGRIMNSRYAGKSSITGQRFEEGARIYFAKIAGVSVAIPVDEIDR